jgi:hypothetical protein
MPTYYSPPFVSMMPVAYLSSPKSTASSPGKSISLWHCCKVVFGHDLLGVKIPHDRLLGAGSREQLSS